MAWSPRCPRAWWGAWCPLPAAGWWRARWWWWWCRWAAASPWAPGPGGGWGRRGWHHATLRERTGQRGRVSQHLSRTQLQPHTCQRVLQSYGMALIYHPKTSPSISDTAVQTVKLSGLERHRASLQKSSRGAHQSKVLQHKEEREHFFASGFQNSANVQLSFAQLMENQFLLRWGTQWKR